MQVVCLYSATKETREVIASVGGFVNNDAVSGIATYDSTSSPRSDCDDDAAAITSDQESSSGKSSDGNNNSNNGMNDDSNNNNTTTMDSSESTAVAAAALLASNSSSNAASSPATSMRGSSAASGKTEKAKVHQDKPWANCIHRFWSNANDGIDGYRNNTVKLFPRVVEGSWAIQTAVGGKPALLGHKLKVHYHRGLGYMEIDIDLSSSSIATQVIKMVRTGCVSHACLLHCC